MPNNSPNLLNRLRQRRRQAKLRRVLSRVASVTVSPKETVQAISLSPSQTLPSIGVPFLPSVEEAVLVYFEEETTEDDDIDPLLADDYLLLDLEHGDSVVSDSADIVEVPAITLNNNYSSPPSSLVEDRVRERKIVSFADNTTSDVSSLPPPQVPVAAWWEGWKSSSTIISDDYTPLDDVNSPPPPQLMVAAWWEGWKHLTNTLQPESIKSRVIPHPSHQVTILAAWWEGWKESSTPQLFSWSSFIILFYSLLLFYTLSESMLYSMPAVYDVSNPYDLLSPQHYLIPTGSLGGWVKVPGHYSSIPRAPPWQHPIGTWPCTQDSTIAQVIHRLIFNKILQSISTTTSSSQPHTPKVTEQTTVFQDPVRIFNPG
jgi:hypothetical protein